MREVRNTGRQVRDAGDMRLKERWRFYEKQPRKRDKKSPLILQRITVSHQNGSSSSLESVGDETHFHAVSDEDPQRSTTRTNSKEARQGHISKTHDRDTFQKRMTGTLSKDARQGHISKTHDRDAFQRCTTGTHDETTQSLPEPRRVHSSRTRSFLYLSVSPISWTQDHSPTWMQG